MLEGPSAGIQDCVDWYLGSKVPSEEYRMEAGKKMAMTMTMKEQGGME